MSIPGADAGLAGGETPDAVEEAGRFRIYLGAAAGVGKTYAVLTAEAGLARWEAG